MSDILQKIERINEMLFDGEPHNVVADNQGRTGYQPQFIINCLNQIIGIGNWGLTEKEHEDLPPAERSIACISRVEVWVKNDSPDDPPICFDAWGEGIQAKSLGDCRKAARTDALKKALSLFSIGNRAYLGLLSKNPQRATERQFNQIRELRETLELSSLETQNAVLANNPNFPQNPKEWTEQHANVVRKMLLDKLKRRK